MVQVEETLKKSIEKHAELKKSIDELNHSKEILQQDSKIIDYILIVNELNNLMEQEKLEEENIQKLKVKLCYEKYGGHFYVSNKDATKNNWSNNTKITCACCGKTQDIAEFIRLKSRDDYGNSEYQLLIDIYGTYQDEEINEVKKIYEDTKKKYASATNEDISKQIALIKKMRGGKLC